MYKKIKGYENYSVNENGDIKNNKTGRILKKHLNDRGYFDIGIYDKNKKSKKFLIHRLVTMTFMEDFNEELQINHIDGDRQNNNINNLECVTSKENFEHSLERKKKSGKKGNISKLKIMKLYKSNKFENIDDFVREIMKW